MNTVKRIWLKDPNNPMYGLENLLSSTFSSASVYYDDYMKVILDIEKKVLPENLMMIYSNILLRNYEIKYTFKEHIIDYIKKNRIDTEIYLWFELCTCNDRDSRIELLNSRLKKEFAVEYNDFVYYPEKANQRIVLFTKLKNNHYLTNFENSEYYKCSMESKNNLEKNTYKDAAKMYLNLQKIFDLLINFFIRDNKKEIETAELVEKIINFQKKIENDIFPK